MLKKLDKRKHTTYKSFEPEEGGRTLLSSNKGGMRSPSLDFNPHNKFMSKEMAIDYLAEILVANFLELKRSEQRNKAGSSILPGFNKRTG